jgi:cyclophilin family peptidyl-prolyl cis-trans isomerase
MARSGGQGVQWMPNPDTKTSGLRAYVEQRIVMNTTLGEITFALRPDHAPNTSWNFMDLVKGGFYTDIIFHRIMGPQNGRGGFMAQVGDPTGTGSGGPGYNIDLENSKLPHDFGVLSMARTADPNTNGSQVFVCFSREGTSFLDGNYCAFAQAVSGADVIKKLEAVEVKSPAGGGEPSQPINPPRIISAKLVDAPPFGTGLKPVSTGANSAAPKPDGR